MTSTLSTTTTETTTRVEPTQQSNDRKQPSERGEPLSVEAERAMARAQVRAQAFVNRPASSESLVLDSSQWPPLVRKKSGELVKSSLRRRPQLARTASEPTRKAVHFNQNLEDVRPFRKTQRPSAVNPAQNKPRFHTGAGGDSFDNGHSHDDDDEDDDANADNEEESGWTLLTPGFVPHRYGRLPASQRPVVYLETLQLTSDKSAVTGSVYVQNRAFNKHVAVRYTMDNWETFSEAQGVWNDDVRKYDRDAGYDRFDITLSLRCFSPKVLCDTAMFMCVRYNVDGEEFWDNNNGANYELYLRNSELLHSLAAQKSEKPTPLRPILGRLQSSGAAVQAQPDSVQEILKSAMRDHRDDLVPSQQADSDYLSAPGIPMKQHSKSNKNRYSFEASYAMPPQAAQFESASVSKLRPRYNVSTAQELARAWMPQEAAVSLPKDLKEGERSASSVAAEPRSAGEQFHTWESQSYKDFVSKYCFYTPITTDGPSARAVQSKRGADDNSREGSPISEISSSESSDSDLSVRHGIALAPERETNRV